MSRQKAKLPNKLIPFKNPEKEGWVEKWHEKRDLLNFPKSYRAVLCGPPSSGKSTVIKNLVVRADPSFEKIIVIHPNANSTIEYDWIFDGLDEDQDQAQVRGDIPSIDEWAELVGENVKNPPPTLVIIDDIEFKSLSKKQQQSLHHLLSHVSSHMNVTVIITAQQFFLLPLVVRRNSNLFVIFSQADRSSMDSLFRKVGITGKKVLTLFDDHLTRNHDSL